MELYQYICGRGRRTGYGYSKQSKGIAFAGMERFRLLRNLREMNTGSRVLEYQGIDKNHIALTASFYEDEQSPFGYSSTVVPAESLPAVEAFALLTEADSIFHHRNEFLDSEKTSEDLPVRQFDFKGSDAVWNDPRFDKVRDFIRKEMTEERRKTLSCFLDYLWRQCDSAASKESQKWPASVLIVPAGWSEEDMAAFFMFTVASNLPGTMPSYLDVVFGAERAVFDQFPKETQCFVLSGEQYDDFSQPLFDLIAGRMECTKSYMDPVCTALGEDLLSGTESEFVGVIRILSECLDAPTKEKLLSDHQTAYLIKNISLLNRQNGKTLAVLSRYILPKYDEIEKNCLAKPKIQERPELLRKALAPIEKHIAEYWLEAAAKDDAIRESDYEWFLKKALTCPVAEVEAVYEQAFALPLQIQDADQEPVTEAGIVARYLDTYAESPLFKILLKKCLMQPDSAALTRSCIDHCKELDSKELHEPLFTAAQEFLKHAVLTDSRDQSTAVKLYTYLGWTKEEHAALFDLLTLLIGGNSDLLDAIIEQISDNRLCRNELGKLRGTVILSGFREEPSWDRWQKLYQYHAQSLDEQSYQILTEQCAFYVLAPGNAKLDPAAERELASEMTTYLTRYMAAHPDQRDDVFQKLNEFYLLVLQKGFAHIKQVAALNLQNGASNPDALVAYGLACLRKCKPDDIRTMDNIADRLRIGLYQYAASDQDKLRSMMLALNEEMQQKGRDYLLEHCTTEIKQILDGCDTLPSLFDSRKAIEGIGRKWYQDLEKIQKLFETQPEEESFSLLTVTLERIQSHTGIEQFAFIEAVRAEAARADAEDWLASAIRSHVQQHFGSNQSLHSICDELPDEKLLSLLDSLQPLFAQDGTDHAEDPLWSTLEICHRIQKGEADLEMLSLLAQRKEKLSARHIELIRKACKATTPQENAEWQKLLFSLLSHFDHLEDGWVAYFETEKQCAPSPKANPWKDKDGNDIYCMNCIHFVCAELCNHQANNDIKNSLVQYLQTKRWKALIQNMGKPRRGAPQPPASLQTWLYQA